MMTLTQEAALEKQAQTELFTSEQKAKVIIKTDALRAALARIASGVATKATVPIMQGVYFHAWTDKIRLRAANGNFYSETEIAEDDFRFENGVEAALVLPGKRFIDLANKVTGANFSIEFDALDTIIRSGGAKAQLKGEHHAQYPDFPKVSTEYSFDMPAGALLSMYKKTAYAVAMSDQMPVLMGVSHEISGGQFRCVATDKYRLSRQYHEVDIPNIQDAQLIVPATTIAEIIKHLKDATNVNISFGGNNLIYRTEKVTIYSGVLEGVYPPTDRLIAPGYQTSFQIGVGELKKIIDRVSLYADEAGASLAFLQLRPENKQMRFSSLESEYGRMIEDVKPTKAEGPELVTSSNVRYLLDALKAYADTDVVKLSFNGFTAFIIQVVGGNDNNLSLIVPVKNPGMPETAEIQDFNVVQADPGPFEDIASAYAENPGESE